MTSNKGGNFRSTVQPFTMVDNRVIENKNLSMKAKGLYLIIMHYVTIPNFVLNKKYLMSLSKEGERAFDSTWKELKDAGYLKQYRLKGEDGKWIYEYELLIEPVIETKEDAKVDIKKEQNKKPSTSAKVAPVKAENENIQSNNSIHKNEKKYTKNIKENNGNKVLHNKHNDSVNNNFTNYEEKELESMLREKQKEKFGDVQSFEFNPNFKI